MKNDNIVWTKTILTVYRYLERIAGAIDKIIMQSALGSGNICGQNYYFNNVYSVTDKIINLSERKVTLINLKVLIEDTLAEIDKKDALILIEKFLDGEKTKEIMERNNISMRTVFRKLDNALKSFGNRLNVKGYDENKIYSMLKDENWILNVYSRYSKNGEEIVLSNIYLAKAVSM